MPCHPEIASLSRAIDELQATRRVLGAQLCGLERLVVDLRVEVSDVDATLARLRGVLDALAVASPPCTPDADAVRAAAAELGRRGGAAGGRARAAKLSPEQRSEIARRAAQARWSAARG
jgi:hypothetical protein